MLATRFFARSLPWRTACWAFGTQKPPTPPPVRSGTALTSPAAPGILDDRAVLVDRRAGRRVTRRRPRSSTGRSVLRTTGLAMTPAVQTIRSEENFSPVDSSTLPSTALVQLRVEVHLGAALGEVLDHPVARLERHLGHDAAHRLDEVEVGVVEGELSGTLREQARGEDAQLGEHLDAGEAAADDDEGEQAVALGAGRQQRGLVEVGDDAVADGDASSMVFRPIALSATPGIGNVRETAPAVTTTIWSYSCSYGSPTGGVIVAVLFAWSMPVTLAVTTLVLLRWRRCATTDVARLDRAGGDLGQERLVGHVGQRVDHGDLGLARAKPLLELPGGVEAGVAAADDQDLGHVMRSPSGGKSPPIYSELTSRP